MLFPIKSSKATDCRRRPIGLCADAQIEDDGPNMEMYHEGTYRCFRVGQLIAVPTFAQLANVPGELLIRV